MSLPAGAMPGLDQLIARLREAPLQVRVSTSEAIDAARLLAHLAAQPGAGDLPLETLRLRLRPVLCKSAWDLPRFNEAFDAWAHEVQAARGQPVALPLPPGEAGGKAMAKPATPIPPEPAASLTKSAATPPANPPILFCAA